MRMGIGITGYAQASEEQKSWLPKAYEYLRQYDVDYSAKHGWPISIKLTTVKPSGTLSLLPGVPPGWHPAYAQYIIRRIQVSSDSPLVAIIKEHGYPIEYVRHFDGTLNRSTMVAEFPMTHPEGTMLAENMTAIDQLEVVRKLQAEWSDNAVSCTIYYKREELPAIKEYLSKYYDTSFKSLSFLLHSDHGFAQAPLEAITKEEYEKRVAKSKPITGISMELDLGDDECASGVCPVR
jgi:ribonucleoside-triphosphate reductase